MNTHKRNVHWIATDCDKCWSTCKNKISFQIQEWNVHGYQVLECEKYGNEFKRKTIVVVCGKPSNQMSSINMHKIFMRSIVTKAFGSLTLKIEINIYKRGPETGVSFEVNLKIQIYIYNKLSLA